MVKIVSTLTFLGAVVSDPFYSYPKPEKFIEWATDAIPIIQEQERWNFSSGNN